jgi:hypothetical protein
MNRIEPVSSTPAPSHAACCGSSQPCGCSGRAILIATGQSPSPSIPETRNVLPAPTRASTSTTGKIMDRIDRHRFRKRRSERKDRLDISRFLTNGERGAREHRGRDRASIPPSTPAPSRSDRAPREHHSSRPRRPFSNSAPDCPMVLVTWARQSTLTFFARANA